MRAAGALVLGGGAASEHDRVPSLGQLLAQCRAQTPGADDPEIHLSAPAVLDESIDVRVNRRQMPCNTDRVWLYTGCV